MVYMDYNSFQSSFNTNTGNVLPYKQMFAYMGVSFFINIMSRVVILKEMQWCPFIFCKCAT